MACYLFRLLPGDDLYLGIEDYLRQNNLGTAAILTCVGSLVEATIRFAGQSDLTVLRGSFEIISLVGVVSDAGSHLHISIADGEGKVVGGHLKPGAMVHTTAEVVLMKLADIQVTREYCPLSGYRELVVGRLSATEKLNDV